jgi:NADP-dependent 3-hydroxy acid dehydrogenase YdfG
MILIAALLLVAAEVLCPDGCTCSLQTHMKCTNVLLDIVLENMTKNEQHIIITSSNISSHKHNPAEEVQQTYKYYNEL